MGMLDMMMPKLAPSAPVELPEFIPADLSGMSDRELMEEVFRKLEAFEHQGKVFIAQASASPLLAQFVPKV